MTGWFYIRITHEYALHFKIIFRHDDAYVSVYIILFGSSFWFFKIIRGIRERTKIHCSENLLILLIAPANWAKTSRRHFVFVSRTINWAAAKLLVIAIARRAICVDWRSKTPATVSNSKALRVYYHGHARKKREEIGPADRFARARINIQANLTIVLYTGRYGTQRNSVYRDVFEQRIARRSF